MATNQVFGFMFSGNTDFNQDISNLDYSSATGGFSVRDLVNNTGLSQANYNALLIKLEDTTTLTNVSFAATGLEYTSAAASARAALVTRGWTITGDSLA